MILISYLLDNFFFNNFKELKERKRKVKLFKLSEKIEK